MKIVRLFIISIVLCSIVLFSLSCAGNPTVTKPKNPLIGKWEAFSVQYYWLNKWNIGSASGVTLEFFDDGIFIERSYKGPESGSYKIIDENHVRLIFSGSNYSCVSEFSISGDELTIQFPYEGVEVTVWKLRRAK